MTDLERVRASATPRDEQLCRELAARFEPSSRYFVYRVLWLILGGVFSFIPAFIVVMVATAATRGLGKPAQAPAPWFVPVLIGTWVLALALSAIPFNAWLRKRRDQVIALFRDGKLVEAAFSGNSTMGTRAGVVHRASFNFSDDERMRAFMVNVSANSGWAVGKSTPVLCLTGFRGCAVFFDGTMRAERTT